METKTEKLGRNAIHKFTKCVTDQLLIFIEHDDELLKEYKDAVDESTTQGVNSVLGKMITEAYHLENVGVETAPKSKLLKKYTKHVVSQNKKKGITDEVPEMFKGDDLFAPKHKTKGKQKGKKKVAKKKSKDEIVETELFELE
jgi:hypothetical protein